VERGANEKCIQNLVGKPGRQGTIWGLNEAGRIVLKWTLKKYGVN
jgi:hypothetical protein